MIRLGKYHLIAALGLVLAYNGVAGMIAASPPPEVGPFLRPVGLSVGAPGEPAVEDPTAGAGPSPGSPAAQDPPAVIIDVAPAPSESAPLAPAAGLLESTAPGSASAGVSTPASPQAADAIRPPAQQADQARETLVEIAPQIALQTPPATALPTPEALSEAPVRLVIPAIALDAPVVPAKARTLEFRGETFQQWLAPAFFAAGWHSDSANLGAPGNTVLNGHHNIDGAVFGRLVYLEIGDRILAYSDRYVFIYQVTNRMIVPEKYQEMDTRMANAQWILPSQDERLTLITCWPDETNTHRVIIVASPIARQALGQ